MSKRKHTRSNGNVADKVKRARAQETALSAKQYAGRSIERKRFTNVVDHVAWAPSDLTQGMSSVTARTANGGREFPRTRNPQVLRTDGTELRNPVIVTYADGTKELRDGRSFNKTSKRTRAYGEKVYNDTRADVVRMVAIVGNTGEQYD